MSASDNFEHIRINKINNITLIEIICGDVQGPDCAQKFSAELAAVASEDSPQSLLLDMARCTYFSSMGYSALFKLVKLAKERKRPIKFCNMHPDVKVGADIVGLHHVVQIYGSRESALEAFGQP